MDELNNLFDDIRKWNRQWNIFEYYRTSPIKKIRDSRPECPKMADDFILELNEKYSVTKK